MIPTDLRSNAVVIDDDSVVDAMKNSPKRRESGIERQIKALSRGLEPEASDIPKQFHRGLKAYRPQAAKPTSD